ncbi:hypothetical protein ZHAS_00016133 [Anopheles sinensis]|uniref:Uncharacterized protein n=1 Tax=Anopheles sinensis TaxID=74873 RepID=A0A084WCS2_ANOSI|nr:hypothetical protein ZHAS_00016133 [Anopheles sinensis]
MTPKRAKVGAIKKTFAFRKDCAFAFPAAREAFSSAERKHSLKNSTPYQLLLRTFQYKLPPNGSQIRSGSANRLEAVRKTETEAAGQRAGIPLITSLSVCFPDIPDTSAAGIRRAERAERKHSLKNSTPYQLLLRTFQYKLPPNGSKIRSGSANRLEAVRKTETEVAGQRAGIPLITSLSVCFPDIPDTSTAGVRRAERWPFAFSRGIAAADALARIGSDGEKSLQGSYFISHFERIAQSSLRCPSPKT